MNEEERSVLSLAEQQYGVVTRRQALKLGMTERQIDRRLAAERLEMVHPGVYRIPGSARNAHQANLAACFWPGKDAALSHGAAGELLHLDGVSSTAAHVTIADRGRHRKANGVVVHRSAALPRVDRAVVDRIPCTSATRTLIDLAAMLDDEPLEVAFESARRMGLTSPEYLARPHERLGGRGRAGSSRIARLLAQQRPGERAAECDGFESHGHRLQWKRDRRRAAALEAQRWRIVHVTWDDVTRRPEETIARLQFALGAGIT